MRPVYPSLCLSAYHRSTRLRLHHGLLLLRRAQLRLSLSLVAALPISLVLPNLHVQMQRHMRRTCTRGAHARGVDMHMRWTCTCGAHARAGHIAVHIAVHRQQCALLLHHERTTAAAAPLPLAIPLPLRRSAARAPRP